jgi:hypothetical protein
MTLITDPDSLNDATEIVISVGSKTVQLVVAGNLSTDGVTIKAVYSKLKELWKSNSTYIKYPFPMGPITDEQFEMVNGWDWADNTTRYLLRTGGWAVVNTSSVVTQMWTGIITLGSIGSGDQAYFLQAAAGSTANFQLTGPVNQAIQVYSDPNADGDPADGFDYRAYLKVYCRIYQKSYAFSQLSEIGVSSVTYQAYRFPLANASDAKITHDDTAVSTTLPYTGMSITWYAAAQTRSIGGTDRYFHVIIDGNGGTAEQIYEYVQYQLRLAGDIDAGAGTQTGKKTGALLAFVGDTLYTKSVAEGGVFIDDYQSVDVNRLVFNDDGGTDRTFPYTAILTLNFGENLSGDADAIYRVFFTNDDAGDNAGYDYGTSNAILVDDATGTDMSGAVSSQTSVQLTFAYDTNVQRGSASAGDDAPITCIGIGLETGQFVKATGTITRSTSNSVSLVAPLERNYQNP